MTLLWMLSASLVLFAAGALGLGSSRWTVAAPLAVAAAVAAAAGRRDRWWPALRAHAVASGAAVDAMAARGATSRIALAAAAGLLAELVLIRWHGSSFQVFSYFKNVSLLAAFLGLGIGYAAAGRPLLLSAAPPMVAVQVVLLRLLGMTGVHDLLQSPISEQAGLGLAYAERAGHWLITYGLLIAVFIATVLTCLPLGQLAGRVMSRVEPLRAYTWNLVGSLGAVAAFAALSLAWTPPTVWLLVLLVMLLPFLQVLPRGSLAASIVATTAAVVVLVTPHRLTTEDHYSPYQVVSVRVRPPALPVIEASRSYFQQIWDLRPEFMLPGTQPVAAYYGMPYAFKPSPARVLVVGSGAGNDVAAALRHGAGFVDAVEIDPLILQLGRDLHPEHPYESPRVRPIVADARAHIRRTTERYDLIVYGLLDSHTVLSGSSSVRLDSYVYTVEALREARSRLEHDGVLVMSFTLVSREIAWKLFLMLREAFGEDPRAFETVYDGGITFVAGPGAGQAAGPISFQEVTNQMRDARLEADVSTDDWPFLYMARRRYPFSYLLMASCLLALSWAAVRSTTVQGQGGPFSLVAFLLGAGFMLVETKAITELALVFGSSWHVTSVVIAGVLVMALLANTLVSRGSVPLRLVYPLLVVSLLAAPLVQVAGVRFPEVLERPLTTALATLPLFFSGIAFSQELRRAGNPAPLLAANLLGAVVGGLLEYNSMYLGVRALVLLGLALYGAAWLASARRGPAMPATAA